MTRESANCIELERLAFRYGGAASFRLEIDSFVLPWGSSVACVGPSGCGKTTLALLLAGVLTPDGGDVRFADHSLSKLPDAERRRIRLARFGMVFQELELIPWLDARDNVLLPFRASPGKQIESRTEARVEDLAASMGITALLGRKPARLSQGERQRVAICRALIAEPDLVLCDEPTGNLDPDRARATLEVLREDVASRGGSVFCITHDHGILDDFDAVLDLTDANRARDGVDR